MFIASWFLWVDDQGVAWLGVCVLASHKTKIQILTGHAINSRLYWGRISLQPHTNGCWQHYVLDGNWPEISVACHMGLSLGQFTIGI